MSEHHTNNSGNGAGMWRTISYALATFSQALIMFLLYLIFQHLGTIDDKISHVETSQARLEGVVSTINFNNPAIPVNKTKEQRQDDN